LNEENLTFRKEKLKSNNNKIFNFFNIKTNILTNYYQTINSSEGDEWKIAINDELTNMYDNNVMEVVDNISNDTNKIDTKWVFVE